MSSTKCVIKSEGKRDKYSFQTFGKLIILGNAGFTLNNYRILGNAGNDTQTLGGKNQLYCCFIQYLLRANQALRTDSYPKLFKVVESNSSFCNPMKNNSFPIGKRMPHKQFIRRVAQDFLSLSQTLSSKISVLDWFGKPSSGMVIC